MMHKTQCDTNITPYVVVIYVPEYVPESPDPDRSCAGLPLDDPYARLPVSMLSTVLSSSGTLYTSS